MKPGTVSSKSVTGYSIEKLSPIKQHSLYQKLNDDSVSNSDSFLLVQSPTLANRRLSVNESVMQTAFKKIIAKSQRISAIVQESNSFKGDQAWLKALDMNDQEVLKVNYHQPKKIELFCLNNKKYMEIPYGQFMSRSKDIKDIQNTNAYILLNFYNYTDQDVCICNQKITISDTLDLGHLKFFLMSMSPSRDFCTLYSDDYSIYEMSMIVI